MNLIVYMFVFIHLFPRFSAVRCCDTCDLHITMQEMNSSMLGSQSLKQLKQYIRCYNLPSQHAIEKDDLVKLIFNTRPITNQNERHYRKLRDQQYAGQASAQEREGANNNNNNNNTNNSTSGGDLFDDNPLSTMFNKLSDLFIPPDPTVSPAAPTPPRQQQQHQQQQRQRPYTNQRPQQHYRPPPPTSSQQHTSSSSYPSYIYPEHQHQHPSSAPRSTTTAARPSSTTAAPSSRQQASSASSASATASPPPSSTPSPPGNTVTLKEMLALSIDPATMSVRTLKHILRTNHVEQNFALEKKELVTRVQQLIEDEKKLQKERHHVDNDTSSGNGGDDIHEDMVCRICYDSVQNCVFLNCGHMATCIDCGLKLVESKNECPICRDSIVRVVRVFRS
ncbi:hypothetical protein BCR42DRAFT_114938 [Absidia repens]|uniref:RING-type domain-containing protein n=1 Tax=Absidia repens TaxID=90262 RepID=A0A1X2I6I1_9FUNG|nr:hypothetical protein BCR42DRAFT_114938 [Absidia repens]